MNNLGYSQTNLISNSTFEVYTICPTYGNLIAPMPWYEPTSASYQGKVYANSCTNYSCASVPLNCSSGGVSYQVAHSGNAYIGLTLFVENLDYRTYIQTKLTDSLKKSKCYYVEFYVSLFNSTKFASNNISLLFTKTSIYVDTFNNPTGTILANPQITNFNNPIITDTLNWVKVSGVYAAQGGEQYITIGNFKTNSNTNYNININSPLSSEADYYIDDVSVIPLDSMPLKADAGKDTSIANIGDSVFIGSLTNGITNITWYNSIGTIINTQAPGFFVKPILSTFYIVEQTVCGYTSRDTVNVTVGTVPLKFTNYELRITNETRNGINEKQVTSNWSTTNEINVSNFNIQRSLNGKDFITIGKVTAQNKSNNEYSFIDEFGVSTPPLGGWGAGLGVVYYRIQSIDKDGKKQYSETRTLNLKPLTLNSFSVYPNPAKDFVTVECKGAKELLIIDCWGRVVYKEMLRQIQNNDNKQSTTINIQGFNKGLYIVKVITNKGEIKTEKLVIE